jgi:Protein of unknown function (DUF1615)
MRIRFRRLFSVAGLFCSLALSAAWPSRLSASDDISDLALNAEQVRILAARIIPRRKAPAQWADAVSRALDEAKIKSRKSNVCSVLAVIEQESNFEANPEVRNLGRISEKTLFAKFQGVPFLSTEIMAFLKLKPDPERNYLKLIRAAKTKRDLDIVWRNIVH